MKNRIIIVLLIIMSLSICGIIIYPEVMNCNKIRDSHKYYNKINSEKEEKEKEYEVVKNDLIELELLNNKTNKAKKDIEQLTEMVEEKNNKNKELDNKIKSVENNIKNQTKERDRLKDLFE